jgi:hypothetical protein
VTLGHFSILMVDRRTNDSGDPYPTNGMIDQAEWTSRLVNEKELPGDDDD